MTFSIEYQLTGAGWAEVVFQQDTANIAMTVSYLRDSLKELADAAIQLSKGDRNALVVFMDEPGEHQVHISSDECELLQIEVRWYSDWASWNIGSQKRYKQVGELTTQVEQFRHQVLDVLNMLYVEVGTEGYREQWGEHDFPMDSYRRLEAIDRR